MTVWEPSGDSTAKSAFYRQIHAAAKTVRDVL
jgi:hypothetical protein